MSDGPQTLLDAVRHFSDLNVCHQYMLALKWPDGQPKCPKCGGTNVGIIATRRLLKCRPCRKQFSAKTDTIFEDSPLGLDKWFPVIWCVANGVKVRVADLADALQISYRGAWRLTHRIRIAMATAAFCQCT